MNQSSHNLKGLRFAIIAALGITALGTAPAWATVTTWTYDASASFGSPTYTSPPKAGCAPVEQPDKLAWGCTTSKDGTQSSLTIAPTETTGKTVNTYVGHIPPFPTAFYLSDPGVNMTHNNHVITHDYSLATAPMAFKITFTDPDSAGSPYTLNFAIDFTETDNTGTSGGCAVTPDPGFDPCPDIFVIDSADLQQQFSYGGQAYTLHLLPWQKGLGIDPLSDEACAAAGVSMGCLGFITQEHASNDLGFRLAINTVPEPGSLGIMGLGLLGVAGLAMRRRKFGIRS